MNKMVIQLDAIDAAEESGRALGLIHTLLALGDGTGMDTIRRQLVVLAQRASSREHRHEAFQLLLDKVPDGSKAIFGPILQMLQERQFEDVVDTIGRDEPFVASPNLFWWRAMAQCGLGRFDQALADTGHFLQVAPDPRPAHYAFRVAILRRTGDDSGAARETALAMARLGVDGMADFSKHLELCMVPNNPFFPAK